MPFDDFTPPDIAKLMKVAAKYHIDIHGPLPEEPEEISSTIISAFPSPRYRPSPDEAYLGN